MILQIPLCGFMSSAVRSTKRTLQPWLIGVSAAVGFLVIVFILLIGKKLLSIKRFVNHSYFFLKRWWCCSVFSFFETFKKSRSDVRRMFVKTSLYSGQKIRIVTLLRSVLGLYLRCVKHSDRANYFWNVEILNLWKCGHTLLSLKPIFVGFLLLIHFLFNKCFKFNCWALFFLTNKKPRLIIILWLRTAVLKWLIFMQFALYNRWYLSTNIYN